MSHLLRSHRQNDRKGFTLLELIVTIVILGILAAIAIPTFLSVITKSQNSAAETSLSSYGEEVATEAALNSDATTIPGFTFSDFTTVAPTASGFGVVASGNGTSAADSSYVIEDDTTGTAASTTSTEVSVNVASGGQSAGLATVDSAGYCVVDNLSVDGSSSFTPYLTSSSTVTANGCVGSLAFSSTSPNSSASSTTTTTTTTIPDGSVPDAPTNLTVTTGPPPSTVGWDAPANDGGSAITGYVVTPFTFTTCNPAVVAQTPVTFSSTATTETVAVTDSAPEGCLEFFLFTVAAINAVGTGPASAASSVNVIP